MRELKHAYIKEIVVEGMLGDTVHESVNEVFAWFYDERDIDKVTMPNVNGCIVTFERKK